MYEKVLITGTPGTGKTVVSDELGKYYKTRVVHVTDFALKNDLIMEKNKDGTLIINMELLRKVLNKENGIIESHLLCEFKLRNSIVIVLRCEPSVLKKRLLNRGYSGKKLKDNLECEALDYCTQMAEKIYKKVYEIDTTEKSISEVVTECVNIIQGRSEGDKVDFSDYFE